MVRHGGKKTDPVRKNMGYGEGLPPRGSQASEHWTNLVMSCARLVRCGGGLYHIKPPVCLGVCPGCVGLSVGDMWGEGLYEPPLGWGAVHDLLPSGLGLCGVCLSGSFASCVARTRMCPVGPCYIYRTCIYMYTDKTDRRQSHKKYIHA